MTCGGADGDGAHHLSVAQAVNLSGVTRDSWAQQSVGGEGHRLHLSVCTHVEGISPAEKSHGTEPLGPFVVARALRTVPQAGVTAHSPQRKHQQRRSQAVRQQERAVGAVDVHTSSTKSHILRVQKWKKQT